MAHVADQDVVGRTSREFWVESIPLPEPTVYEAHRHEQHQLAWMRSGEMELDASGQQLHLHAGHLVWIPGHTRHQMTVPAGGHLVSAYAASHLRPAGDRWNRIVVLPVDSLTADLLVDLSASGISRRRRGLAQALLYDTLETAAPSDRVLAMPGHPCARRVAEALLDDITDDAELKEWAMRLDVSPRTLTRGFVDGTGLTFRRWRTTARVHRARRLLAEGVPVADVSVAVGYHSPSAFIGAYRSVLGSTPGRDRRAPRPSRPARSQLT